MNFFDRQEASHRATRHLVLLFGLSFLAVGLATGVVLLAAVGAVNINSAAVGDNWFMSLTNEPQLLAITVAIVVGLMIVASLFRHATLSQGGGHVARMLGGTRIQSDDQDPSHRRLLNVVEEMAIASGLPVPEVYVLERERGINAFAAGLTPADAAVAVTRGSLEQLDRAELQGVIAHEFSHILNGDMRLNLRLIGFSFGILVLFLIGRWLLRAAGRGARFRVGKRGDGSALIMIGLLLTVIGGIGVVLSRLIKAAVSRQREVLADASAVQFTREPLALAGALKKIGGFTPFLETVESEEVSHMLFGRAGRSFSGLFATHPPLPERIRALDPSFEPGDYIAPAQGAPTDGGPEGDADETAGISHFDAANLEVSLDAAGTIAPSAGGRLRMAIPTDLADAARSTQSAWLLVLALGLERSGATEAGQTLIETQIGRERAARCFRLRRQLTELDPALQLPLFELAVPALRARPDAQIDYLFGLLDKLVTTDGHVSLVETLLMQLMRVYFYPPRRAHSDASDQLKAGASLISIIATEGHDDDDRARAAFAAGLESLGVSAGTEQTLPSRTGTFDAAALDSALNSLVAAPMAMRRRVLVALAVTMRHDARMTLVEVELFRTIAAVLGCPVPPTG